MEVSCYDNLKVPLRTFIYAKMALIMPTWVLTSAEVAIAYGVDQVGSILPALELLPFDSNAGKVDQT